MAQRIKRLPAMWETQVQSLGWEDPLEKEMATQSSILAWRIPWTEEPGGYRPCGCKERNTAEQLSTQPKTDMTSLVPSVKRVVVGGSARWGCSKVDVDR